ncbi:MAG: flippase-like domain-containing protein [Actinomycetota bacterium]|nr:flippase-like domain-containing protein [Actinomycetota bacterium]
MRLSAGVAQVACRHRRSLALVGSLTAFATIAVVLAGRWDEFLRALGGAPLGILALAGVLQVASLLTRSESWNLCVRAAGGAVSRRRVYRAAGVGYAVNIINGQLGFAMRIAALRRSAPGASPKALALAATEVPILLVEAGLAALFSFTLVGPLGLPWWIPPAAFAAMLGALLGLRSVSRRRPQGWGLGLGVMRDARARTRVIALVTLGIVFQIVRNWLVLGASGVDASVLDATAVIIAVAVLGALPLGPSTGAGAAVLVLGGGDIAAVAAAGVLFTATGAVGALAYAAWSVSDRAWVRRRTFCHLICDHLRTRSAQAAVRGMPADLGAIPAPRRRLIELSYFGGLTHIQLARLLPSPA